ncbi:MAG: hypothetical protein LBD13_04415 [Spirochaetaceae bacterium]|nr:hypothetical protein [Spirochaetaceae bacterium]
MADAGGTSRRPPAPNCLICRHFKVTWEPAHPRSCRIFGIKSRSLPSLEVFRATGRQCPSFEPPAGG